MVVPAGLLCAWPDTEDSIPDGWERVASLDGMYLRGASVAGGTGGAATHTHTVALHTHTTSAHSHTLSGTSDAGAAQCTSILDITPQAQYISHAHTASGSTSPDAPYPGQASVTMDSQTNNSSYLQVIWIRSQGTTSIPPGAIVWLPRAIPTGWSAQAQGAFLLGAPAGADGGATHTRPASHSHTATASHTHSISHSHGGASDSATLTTINALLDAEYGLTIGASHLHPIVLDPFVETSGPATPDTHNTANMDPPWISLYAARNDTGAPASLQGMVLAFQGLAADVPPGWRLCDGTKGSPDLHANRFLYGATNDTDLLTTGGSAASHTHTAYTHTHTDATHAHANPVLGYMSSGQQAGVGSTGGTMHPMGDHQHAAGSIATETAGSTISSYAVVLASSVTTPPSANVLFVQYWPVGQISEAVNPYGQRARVWEDNIVGQIGFELSLPDGTWVAATYPFPAGSYRPSLEWLRDGRLHVAYDGGSGPGGIGHSYSTDDGETWV